MIRVLEGTPLLRATGILTFCQTLPRELYTSVLHLPTAHDKALGNVRARAHAPAPPSRFPGMQPQGPHRLAGHSPRTRPPAVPPSHRSVAALAILCFCPTYLRLHRTKGCRMEETLLELCQYHCWAMQPCGVWDSAVMGHKRGRQWGTGPCLPLLTLCLHLRAVFYTHSSCLSCAE